MSNQVVVFSYAALTPEIQTQLRQTAEAIRSSTSRQVDEIVATGRALVNAKSALAHGQFGVWLGTEFNWSTRTAQRYIAVAEAFGSNATCVSHLPVAVVYRLAALPLQVRERVLRACPKGESETVNLIVQEASKARQAAVEVAKAPETKALEKARKTLRDREFERHKAAHAAEEAKCQLEAEALIREIVDAAPEMIEKLEALLHLPGCLALKGLGAVKADMSSINSVRCSFSVRDNLIARSDIFDTLYNASREYQLSRQIFPGNLSLAMDSRLWEQERKTASGQVVKSVSLHGFVHDHFTQGIKASWKIVEQLLEGRPDVLDRWNALRMAEGGHDA